MIGNFLVSPKMGAYLHHFENGATVCVAIPSMAERYGYVTADKLAYLLRSNGFEQAHVADLFGTPATPEAIANAQASEFTVVFNEIWYFAGLDQWGSPQGTTDPKRVVSLSKAAVREIYVRLRKMFDDAKVVEFSNESVEDELESIRGLAPNPQSFKFKDAL